MRKSLLLIGILLFVLLRMWEVNAAVNVQSRLYEQRVHQAEIIGRFTGQNCEIWTDAHYPELFFNKTMERHPYHDCIYYLSFQQHSYSDQFRSYISRHFGKAQRYDVYFSKLAARGAPVIISESRAKTYQKLIDVYYKAPLHLVRVTSLSNGNSSQSPFDQAGIWKIIQSE